MWSWLETSNNKITETQLEEKEEKEDLKNQVTEVNDKKELPDIKEETEVQLETELETESDVQSDVQSEGESDGMKEAEWEKNLDKKSCCKNDYIHFSMKRSHAIVLIVAYTINLFLAVYGLKKY